MGLQDQAKPPGDQAAQIRQLQDEVRALQTARRGEHTSVGEGGTRWHSGGSATFEGGGGVEVRDGGDIEVLDGGELRIRSGSLSLFSPSGERLVLFGTIVQGGENSRGWIFSFDQGDDEPTTAFSLGGDPGQQFWSLRDHDGNILVSNDSVSGGGLARPYIPMPLPKPVGVGHWSSTDSASFAAIDRSSAANQHPWIAVSFSAFAEAGTTGDVRFTVNGTQVGDTATVSDGEFGGAEFEAEMPAGIGFGSGLTLELQARRTAGTGEVYGICRAVYGVQSL